MKNSIIFSLVLCTIPGLSFTMEFTKIPSQAQFQEQINLNDLILDSIEKETCFLQDYVPFCQLFVQKKGRAILQKLQEKPRSKVLRDSEILKQYVLRTACQLYHPDFIEFLVKKVIAIDTPIVPFFTIEKSNPNQVSAPVLHMACEGFDPKTAELLLRLGANVNSRNSRGSTALHTACQVGRQDIVHLLVDAKAIIDAKDDCDFTPLHVACLKGNKAITEFLYKHKADIHDTRNNKGNALLIATHYGQTEMVQFLLDKGADCKFIPDGLPVLHVAVINDHKAIVRLLLDKYPELCRLAGAGNITALHAVCGVPDSSSMVQILIDNDADVNAKCIGSLTPLHIACSMQDIKTIKKLLEHGARVDIECDQGMTPLEYAYIIENIEIIELLKAKSETKQIKNLSENESLNGAAQLSELDYLPPLVSTNETDNDNNAPLKITSINNAPNSYKKSINGTPISKTKRLTKHILPKSEKSSREKHIDQIISDNNNKATQRKHVEYKINQSCEKINWPVSMPEKTKNVILEKLKDQSHCDIKHIASCPGYLEMRQGEFRVIFSKDASNIDVCYVINKSQFNATIAKLRMDKNLKPFRKSLQDVKDKKYVIKK